MSTQHDIKVSRARGMVYKKWPYLMETIYGLIFRPSKEIPTFAVTPGMVVLYNEDYLDTISEPETATAIVHECQHVLRNTCARAVGKDFEVFCMAADLPINSDLKKTGWACRSEWLYPETFGFKEGLTTEQYYELLKQEIKKNPSLGGNEGKGKGGKKQPGIGSGGCHCPKELAGKTDSQKTEAGETLGRSALEQKRIIKQTMEAAKSHQEQHGRGSLPGFMQELVDAAFQPSRIPWRQRLQYVIRDLCGPIIAGGDDFSIRHPSKRSHVRRLLRPGLVDHTMTPLFVIDTSGSMSKDQMVAGVQESVAVLLEFGIDEAFICHVDHAVAMEPKRVNITDLVGEIVFHGRGGTDFRPGLMAGMQMHPRPDLIFYFTDGDGYAPKTPCPIPVIWGIVPNSRRGVRPASWGTIVTITDDPTYPEDDDALSLSPEEEETDMDEYQDIAAE